MTMAKSLIEKFSEDWFKELRQARTNEDAYDKTTQRFEQDHGFIPFNSYDSFRKKLHRQKKKTRR